MDTAIEDLLRSQEARRLAGQEKMKKRQALSASAPSYVPQGETRIERKIQTGTATGSQAFGRNPEDIVIGENKPWQKRRDFEIVNRKEEPAPPEDQ